ncbi:hypothetical protein PRUPE_6G114100 [Prunus persica]|uniref:Late embryogenesis abundant protein LEA-2 subgroup domain-containing protein n=1 Tax=Prunus persica TaxID=3760 RepID=M5WCX8_PRUPE|nr:uncharacterized protein At1g08160 [Prunus persica]ONI00964.1 hypothetical protein PRUPE_6G114100 [Prunus persica]
MPTSTSLPSQAPKSRSNPIRLIAIVLLACIVLLGIVVLITWLILKPKRLVYTIEDGSIQNFNLTNDHLSADFDFVLRAYNPNKRVSLYYDSIQATVNYNDQTLAFSGVDPFYQRHRNVTRFNIKFTAHSTALPSSVSNDLQLEKRSGRIQFDVWLKARIRFKVGAWKSRHRTLRVSCAPVLEFSRPKNLKRTYCYAEI